MTTANPFIALTPGDTQPLPGLGEYDDADHVWSQAEIRALTLAYSAGRPLLVRGEPGCGKSQLARAAACVLQVGLPFVEVIHPGFEPKNLLFTFDAVHRLADAQLGSRRGAVLIKNRVKHTSAVDWTNRRYTRLGALGHAFSRAVDPRAPAGRRDVVLIDEIDKADSDLPNSLLEVLGNRKFRIDPIQHEHALVPADRMPLILITTNEERELPAAFVRRCVVLNLNPPEDRTKLHAWLVARVSRHRALANIDPAVMGRAADQVIDDRNAAERAGYPKVGLAELVDLLSALAQLTRDEVDAPARRARQNELLDQLSRYALVKHPRQDQDRAPTRSKGEPPGALDPSA